MTDMGAGYWRGVVRDGVQVPPDRSLGDLTAELTTMLGSPDPELRDGLAMQVLTVWIGRGVYDELLVGLGDGMVAGLRVGIGETEGTSVFRRSWSARVIAQVLRRDNDAELLSGPDVLRWGDLIAVWMLREEDVRGWIPGQGTARAVAHGADAIAALASSRHLERLGLTVLLDVLADRVLDTNPLLSGEIDHLAAAAVQVVNRELVSLEVLEQWIARIASEADPEFVAAGADPHLSTHNAQTFLRTLHLLLLLGPHRPRTRADLLLVISDALQFSNPQHLPRWVTGK